MLLFSARVYFNRTGPKADRCAKQLFGFSILYLFLLFAEIAWRAGDGHFDFEHAMVIISELKFKPRRSFTLARSAPESWFAKEVHIVTS